MTVARAVEAVIDDDGLEGDEARAALRTIMDDDPAPAATTFSTWDSDPFAAGSYTHLPVGATLADVAALARPVGPRLLLAGESTHAQYMATMHGAYLSGLRAADEALGWL